MEGEQAELTARSVKRVHLDTKLLSISELRVAVREGVGLSSESVTHLQSEVTESSDADDSDLLAGSSTEALEGAVGGDTSAQKGSDGLVIEGLGDRNGEATTAASVVGVCERRKGQQVDLRRGDKC